MPPDISTLPIHGHFNLVATSSLLHRQRRRQQRLQRLTLAPGAAVA
jgi:hypothetical protein